MIKTLLLSTKPVDAAASPVNELSSEITTACPPRDRQYEEHAEDER